MSGNGSSVTRAELAAHIQRIDESLSYMRGDIAEINEKMSAPARWFGARLTKLTDWALMAVIAFTAAMIATHL